MQSGRQQYRSSEGSRDVQENFAGLDFTRPAEMRRNGWPTAVLHQRTSSQNDQRGDLEVPPAASQNQEPEANSSSVSVFSKGLNSDSAVVVHGIPSSVSREAVTSIFSKFGSIRRVKHIKYPHSKKTRCLVDFYYRGAAQHLIQIGFIRYVDKFLKVSDPKKIARLQAEPESRWPGQNTIYVWGPQGRTVVPRTEPRVEVESRSGRAIPPTMCSTSRVELEADGSGLQGVPGRESRPYSASDQQAQPNSRELDLTRSSQVDRDGFRSNTIEYEVHVDQDIVTTYRIKHRGVIYQQVVHSSNGWFLSSLTFPTELLI